MSLVALCSLYVPEVMQSYRCVQLLQAKMKGGPVWFGPPCRPARSN